jgi:hypothetical protein
MFERGAAGYASKVFLCMSRAAMLEAPLFYMLLKERLAAPVSNW